MNIFRNILRAVAVSAAAGFLMAVSCNPIPGPGPDPGPDTPQDTTKPVTPIEPSTLIDTTLAVGVQGTTFTMSLTSNAEWSGSVRESDAPWCTVSPQSGVKGDVTVTIKIDPNQTYDPRSATIDLKAGESTGIICIEQNFLKGFELELNDYVMPPLGGRISVDLKTNVDYTCRIEGGEWVTQTEATSTKGLVPHTHLFDVDRNTTGADRTCTIVFEGEGFSRSFSVMQHHAYLTVSKNNISFGKDAASEKIEILSNVEYEMVLPSEEWLWKEGDIVSEEGEATVNSITFNAVENPFPTGRDAMVLFVNKDYGLCDTLYISQSFETYFSVSEKQFNYGPEGGESEVTVTTNMDYSCNVPEEAGWITEEKKGSVHVFRIAWNASSENRSAQVVFTAGEISEKVTFSQKGAVLQIDKTEAEFGISGGEVTVRVDHNIPFDVVMPSDSWIGRRDAGTDSYLFTVAENGTSSVRECEVVFRSEEYGMCDTLRIRQERCVVFNIPQKQFVVSDAGGKVTVNINANIEYEYALEGSPDWISEEEPLVFRVVPNTSSEGRSATLKITSEAEGIFESVVISQKQKDVFSLSAYDFHFGPEGGVFTIEVSSNVEYSYYVEDAPGWISETGGKLRFEVDRNIASTSRQCSIVFTSGASVQYVTVSQDAPSLSVSPSSVSVFPVAGGKADFTVTANIPYKVEMPQVQWISQRSGGSEGKFGISVDSNSGNRRECSVVVSSPEYNISRTIKISQDQQDRLSISPEQFNIGPEGGEITIAVESNVDYTASSRNSWISELSAKSSAASKVFSIGRNTTSEARSGNVVFDGNGLTATATVNQAAPVLTISKSEAAVTADGGNVEFTVGGNISYQCAAEKSWVTYTDNSGTIRLNVARNTTGAARTCIFTVKNDTFGITRTLTVTQAQNNVLSVDKTSYSFTSDGGSFTPVVTANVEYTIDVPVSWITRSGGKFTVAANSETTSRSATITYSGEGLSCTIAVTQEAYVEPEPVPLDGRVTKLQTHTEGNGVNIVLMGDAFTEEQNNDGTYEAMMRKGMEAFFNVEPYTTFRNLFDVYMVNVVSQSGNYDGDISQRKLKTKFGKGTQVEGDNVMCKRYALHAVKPDRNDWQTVRWENDNMINTEVALGNTLVIVMMNRKYYAGTCYMGVYWIDDPLLNFTQGNSVAYFSLGVDEDDFEALLHHEAGGHGFGYLADEYCYPGTGTMPQDEIDDYKYWQNNFHAYLNMDFTTDPTKVHWAHFLADERYSDQGLGVFEGASGYYEHGAYKSTEQSIMRDNVGTFNAPSREQIYKRLFKLAYGRNWTYDYEEFVEYDAVNRVPATKAVYHKPLPHTGRSVLEVFGR